MLEFIAIIAATFASAEPESNPFFSVNHRGETVILIACQTEDAQNCVWDAAERGNGLGTSFYDMDGFTYYIPVARRAFAPN